MQRLSKKLKDEVKADTACAREGPQIPYIGGSFSSQAGGAIIV
jgi:hypothetical protein